MEFELKGVRFPTLQKERNKQAKGYSKLQLTDYFGAAGSPTIYLSIYLSFVYPSSCQFLYLSIQYLPSHLSVCLSVCLSVRLSNYLCFCMEIFLSIILAFRGGVVQQCRRQNRFTSSLVFRWVSKRLHQQANGLRGGGGAEEPTPPTPPAPPPVRLILAIFRLPPSLPVMKVCVY